MNEITPLAATWVDVEVTILSEVSQKEKDKYCRISLIRWNLKKKIQMNLFTKQKQTHRHRKQIMVTEGERG